MLEIDDLHVDVAGMTVLSGIDLTLKPGELHVLLGPNGSGKSSLLATILGLPPYRVTRGTIRLDGKPLADLPQQERARLGIGMAFQRPPSLDGVSVRAFAAALGAEETLAREAAALDLVDFLRRDMNVGFSRGEIKRWEILKLLLQNPRLMLFDEPESGVDLEHVMAIGHPRHHDDRRGRRGRDDFGLGGAARGSQGPARLDRRDLHAGQRKMQVGHDRALGRRDGSLFLRLFPDGGGGIVGIHRDHDVADPAPQQPVGLGARGRGERGVAVDRLRPPRHQSDTGERNPADGGGCPVEGRDARPP
ncbi:FeS assembly ATPase SufC [Rhodovulum sp. ES.010]|nr:FeS assembly ATPase SufC [Rhodovulum sp. ES.010]